MFVPLHFGFSSLHYLWNCYKMIVTLLYCLYVPYPWCLDQLISGLPVCLLSNTGNRKCPAKPPIFFLKPRALLWLIVSIHIKCISKIKIWMFYLMMCGRLIWLDLTNPNSLTYVQYYVSIISSALGPDCEQVWARMWAIMWVLQLEWIMDIMCL